MKTDISRAIALLPVVLLVMTAGCAPQQVIQDSSSAQSIEASDKASSLKPIESNSSAAPPVEFHPGYPPAWVKNFKNLPLEVIPGAKLGYSKEESAKRLRPEVKELLDVARRLYYEPGLLAQPQKVLSALHINQTSRQYFQRTMADGTIDKAFRDDFKAGGLFNGNSWSGAYYYEGRVNAPPPRWDASLKVNVNPQRECIDSRAVEGYLDLPLDPGLWPPAIHPLPRELWNRHGKSGGGLARSPVPAAAGVSVGFVNGCLVRLDFSSRFDLDRVSNAEVLKQ